MVSNPCLLQFPIRGGPVDQNMKCKKVAEFRGESLWGAGLFPPKVRLAPGNCVFSCPSGPGISQSAKGLEWAKTPLNRYFQPVGVQPKKRLFPRKLRKTIPESMVTFFSHFGTPFAVGPTRGPAGLACCCCLMLARRTGSTQLA